MKKASKVLIIIGLCFFVFGILITTAAGISIWTTGASWYDNIHIYSARTQSRELDSITVLDLDGLINEPVYIVRGGDKVVIEWSQRYDNQYSLSAREGGTLSLSRRPFAGLNIGRWSIFNVGNIGGWGIFGRDFDIENGSNRPVTVTIPERMDLSRIEIRGVDIRITMDNIDAKNIYISGVNAMVSFRHNDIESYNYETSGVGSSLRIDGERSGGIGSFSKTHPGASRHVTVSGVSAELDVRRK